MGNSVKAMASLVAVLIFNCSHASSCSTLFSNSACTIQQAVFDKHTMHQTTWFYTSMIKGTAKSAKPACEQWVVVWHGVVSVSRLPKNSTSTTSSGLRSTTVGSAPCPAIVKRVALLLLSRFKMQSVSIKVILNKYLMYSLSYLCWSFHCKISQQEDYKNTGFPLHYTKAGKLYQLVMKNYIVAKKSLTHYLRCC